MSAEPARRTVWAVATGEEYEFTGVLFVCDTRGRAERSVAMLRNARAYSDVHVEEIDYRDTDPVIVDIYEQSVAINVDDDVIATSATTYQAWADSGDPLLEPVQWRWVRHRTQTTLGGRVVPAGSGELRVWGTDREQVAEVFNERRALLVTDDGARVQAAPR